MTRILQQSTCSSAKKKTFATFVHSSRKCRAGGGYLPRQGGRFAHPGHLKTYTDFFRQHITSLTKFLSAKRRYKRSLGRVRPAFAVNRAVKVSLVRACPSKLALCHRKHIPVIERMGARDSYREVVCAQSGLRPLSACLS